MIGSVYSSCYNDLIAGGNHGNHTLSTLLHVYIIKIIHTYIHACMCISFSHIINLFTSNTCTLYISDQQVDLVIW